MLRGVLSGLLRQVTGTGTLVTFLSSMLAAVHANSGDGLHIV